MELYKNAQLELQRSEIVQNTKMRIEEERNSETIRININPTVYSHFE